MKTKISDSTINRCQKEAGRICDNCRCSEEECIEYLLVEIKAELFTSGIEKTGGKME